MPQVAVPATATAAALFSFSIQALQAKYHPCKPRFGTYATVHELTPAGESRQDQRQPTSDIASTLLALCKSPHLYRLVYLIWVLVARCCCLLSSLPSLLVLATAVVFTASITYSDSLPPRPTKRDRQISIVTSDTRTASALIGNDLLLARTCYRDRPPDPPPLSAARATPLLTYTYLPHPKVQDLRNLAETPSSWV